MNVHDAILQHWEKVDILPSSIELSGLEVSLVNAMSRETIDAFVVCLSDQPARTADGSGMAASASAGSPICDYGVGEVSD